jgi:peptidoglycan hydrolase-like protein with peptidoglycan-binding domain
MPGSQRDLAVTDPWIASLERSLARRARASRRARRLARADHRTLTPPLSARFAQLRPRDLAEVEPWELSLGRSRARRRAAQLQFVPAGTRAKRLSLGTLAALSVGPAASVADGPAAATAAAPPADPPTPTTSQHDIVLSGESEGRQVALLQQALGGVKVDGAFGPETEAAVRHFQESRGLTVDGVAGPQTNSALRSRASAAETLVGFHGNVPGEAQDPSQQSATSALGTEAGASGAQASTGAATEASNTAAIKRLQAALHLPVDGEFGPETLAAVERLQSRHGVSVDGVVGPQTWQIIGVSNETVLTPPASALPPEPEPAPAEAVPTAGSTGGAEAAGEPVAVAAESGPAGPPSEGSAGPGAPEAPASSGEREAPASSEGPHESAPEHSISSPSASAGSEGSPGTVGRVIAAGNEIATRPYVWGGGHGSFQSNGYDCSGSVSYALHGGGLLNSPQDSSELESYGESGPGKHITIYANSEHTFMVVNGKRFDTVAQAETGSRWSSSTTSTSGYVVRHPAGY